MKGINDLFMCTLEMIPSFLGISMRASFLPKFLKHCGKNPKIMDGVRFAHPDKISIGDNVFIGTRCLFSGVRGVIE